MPSTSTHAKSKRSTRRASRPAKHVSLPAKRLQNNARDASDFLKAIAHEGRLMILCQLIDGAKTVTELAQAVNMRQPSVSQQLSRLREEKLVENRRNGKNVYYLIAHPEVRSIVATLYRAFCQR
jgi:DNA-binding transcriptional ArsR family regulator